jgi:hypothetical protein
MAKKAATTAETAPVNSTFNPGDLILNDEHHIASKTEKINTVVLSCNKYYKENKAYDPDDPEMPNIIPTKAEVHAAGFTTDWLDDPARPGKRLRPDYQEASTLTLLLEKPAELQSPLFCLEFEDKWFAPAIFYVDKSAWRHSAKKVFSASQMELAARGILSGLWTLHTEIMMKGSNPTVVPVLNIAGINSDPFQEWLKQTFIRAVREPTAV